jgi:hypothetical protein
MRAVLNATDTAHYLVLSEGQSLQTRSRQGYP